MCSNPGQGCANTPERGIDPTILPQRQGSLILARHLVNEKKNSEFKPLKIRKKIYPMLHATHGGGFR